MAWRTKSVEQSIADTDEPSTRLRKDLTWWDLTVFGVSVVIGAGIFTITASTAGNITGPAIALSFVIAAITCGLAALCYAEFASTLPVAGSAYTFSYATFGEFIAWIIGWDLILEFAVAAAVVAKGWSSYLGTVFGFGGGTMEFAGLQVDWGALLIIAFVTAILAWGTKLSAKVSLVITVVKVSVVLLVVVVGAFYIKSSNYTPFIPPAESGSGGGTEQSLLSLITGAEGSNYGWYGLLGGRVDRVLRVHRLRHRRHHRRGDQESAARRPARHPGLAGYRHRALRRGGRRADRHGALHRAQGGR